MKTIFKKILVICAIFLAVFAVANLKPSGEANAAGGNAECRYFLGLNSWDCNIDPSWKGDETLKSNIVQIALNVFVDITVLAAYLVLGFVIYGGYQYLLSSGEAAKVAAGKKTLIHAFIGLAIVLLSHIILNTIRIALMGSNGGDMSECVSGECVTPGNLVSNLITWVIGIAGTVSLIFIFIGGISYMTAAGEPAKLQKAKQTILYAAIGLVIVAISMSVTALVTGIINGAKGSTPEAPEEGYIYDITKENHEIIC